MENEFITYNQALALAELGFDEPWLGYYNEDKGFFITGDSEQMDEYVITLKKNCIKALLYQQVFRWFREKHGLYSIIHCPTKKTAVFTITGFDVLVVHSMQQLKTYEEAESACLDKLIEIIKNK
jgi:hypothetical protein